MAKSSDKGLRQYFERKDRTYWHYYHLKRDEHFKEEVRHLIPKIRMQTKIPIKDGFSSLPTLMTDYKDFKDPHGDEKIRIIWDFMDRWNVHTDYSLLSYLIRGDDNRLPPKNDSGSFSYSFDEENLMFRVDLPVTVKRKDLDILWLLLTKSRKDAGYRTPKSQRLYTLTEHKAAIAFDMWKMRKEGKSWTYVTKQINAKYGAIYSIRDAQDFLRANGFYI